MDFTLTCHASFRKCCIIKDDLITRLRLVGDGFALLYLEWLYVHKGPWQGEQSQSGSWNHDGMHILALMVKHINIHILQNNHSNWQKKAFIKHLLTRKKVVWEFHCDYFRHDLIKGGIKTSTSYNVSYWHFKSFKLLNNYYFLLRLFIHWIQN